MHVQIAKLVVVSSTGFLGPGLDCDIIKGLGLSTSVDRRLLRSCSTLYISITSVPSVKGFVKFPL